MANKVGIVGATGAVGHELLAVMEQRGYPVDELRLFASPRSAGQRLAWKGKEHTVEALDAKRLGSCDVVFFSAGAGVSKEWAP